MVETLLVAIPLVLGVVFFVASQRSRMRPVQRHARPLAQQRSRTTTPRRQVRRRQATPLPVALAYALSALLAQIVKGFADLRTAVRDGWRRGSGATRQPVTAPMLMSNTTAVSETAPIPTESRAELSREPGNVPATDTGTAPITTEPSDPPIDRQVVALVDELLSHRKLTVDELQEILQVRRETARVALKQAREQREEREKQVRDDAELAARIEQLAKQAETDEPIAANPIPEEVLVGV